MRIDEVLFEQKIIDPFDLLSNQDLVALGKALRKQTTEADDNSDILAKIVAGLDDEEKQRLRTLLTAEVKQRQEEYQQQTITQRMKQQAIQKDKDSWTEPKQIQPLKGRPKTTATWKKIIAAILAGSIAYGAVTGDNAPTTSPAQYGTELIFAKNKSIDINKLKTADANQVIKVQKFLKDNGFKIAVDGKVGPQTLRAAEKYNNKNQPVVNSFNTDTAARIMNKIANDDPKIRSYKISGSTIRIDLQDLQKGYYNYLKIQGLDPQKNATLRDMLGYHGFSNQYKQSIKDETNASDVIFYINNNPVR
jgi:lysozyme family protein